MFGFSLSGILYFVIVLILVHGFVFGMLYIYLGQVAAAAKQHLSRSQKESYRDSYNKKNNKPMGL